MSHGTEQRWADDTGDKGVEVQGPPLAGLYVGVKVGETTKDAVAMVMVDGEHVCLAITPLHSKEGSYDGMKCFFVVLHCSDGVVGNALKIKAV